MDTFPSLKFYRLSYFDSHVHSNLYEAVKLDFWMAVFPIKYILTRRVPLKKKKKVFRHVVEDSENRFVCHTNKKATLFPQRVATLTNCTRLKNLIGLAK